MAARWPGVAWQVPEGHEQGGHEAMLLKLSCDKVLFHLNWRAVLQFHETVELTVDWYHTWHEGEQDIYNYTVGQIERYCQLAQTRDLVWIQT